MIRHSNKKGQSVIEYAIICSAIAVAAITSVQTLGQHIEAKFAEAALRIDGGPTERGGNE